MIKGGFVKAVSGDWSSSRIKNSVLEALEKEFQAKYNSTVLKNRETTVNIQ